MKYKKTILITSITIILTLTLLSWITIEDIITTLLSISFYHLLLIFILYIFTYFFRALRFHILLDSKIHAKDLFVIVCVHNMVNNIVPSRIGEFSYIYLVKKLHGIFAGESITTLMISRVFDFIMISLFFFISVKSICYLPDMISEVIWFVALLTVSVLLLLVGLLLFKNKLLSAIQKIIDLLNLDRFHVVNYLSRLAKEILKAFDANSSKKIILLSSLYSFLIWFFAYLLSYVMLHGLGIHISIWQAVVISSLPLFSVLLPIQGVGGFGTLEGAWIIGLVSFGIPMKTAIITGFSIHIISLLYILIFGIYGLMRISGIKGQKLIKLDGD